MGSKGSDWKGRVLAAERGTSTGCEAGERRGSGGGDGNLRWPVLLGVGDGDGRSLPSRRDCSPPMVERGDRSTFAVSCGLLRGGFCVCERVRECDVVGMERA